METFRPNFDWQIGDRVHVLQKSEKSLAVALNGIAYILSINHPIARRLYSYPVDTMLIIVNKRTIIYNHEGKPTYPGCDDCVGKMDVPVYIRVSL